MLPYWALFGTFSFAAILKSLRATDSRGWALLLLCAAGAALFIGLRFEVGADWEPYTEIFRRTRYNSLSEALTYGDPGFYILIWLIHRIGLEIWALNLVCSLIFLTGLTSFAKRQPNPWLAIAVTIPYLVIVVAMSGTRQATAIGFIFLALNAYEDRKLARAVMWTAFAATFHASAIIMLGVFAWSYSSNRLLGVAVLALTLLIGQVFLSSTFEIYVDRYSNPEIQSDGTIFRILMSIVPSLIYLRFADRFDEPGHRRSFWRNMSLLALVSLPALILVPSSTALDRLSLYLVPLQAYVLGRAPATLSRSQRENKFLVTAIVSYLLLIMLVWLNFASHAEAWLPYQIYPLF